MSLINFDSKMLSFASSNNGFIESDCLEQLSPYDRPINTHECEDFGDAIVFFHNVLDKEMCAHIIDACDYNNGWRKAETHGEASGAVKPEDSPRQNDICSLTNTPGMTDIDAYIHRVLTTTLNAYMKKLDIDNVNNAGLTEDEGYAVLRYNGGGYYKAHIDYSSQSMGVSPAWRVVTGLIYLNDDYEGGEVEFPRQKVKVKPTRGGIIFFPSIFTHPHSSLPIKKGTKYCIVTWWK